MLDAEEQLAWALLARAPQLDVAAVSSALRRFGSAAGILRAAAADRDAALLPPAANEFLTTAPAAGRAELRWLDSPRHHLVPFTAARFPKMLLDLPDCPVALYVAGNLDALSEPQLAIVGSRNPTPQGAENARAFAAALGARGLAVTSGLAQGIDGSAHRGALDAQAITLAVLGTGIDVVYPESNRALGGQIELHGALLSEFPLGTPPRRANFPRRNRIIAGLCLGTLVVEAALRSGSLLTARSANAYGREVFAIPGSIHNPQCRGCHALIKGGAKLTESVDDILTELNFSSFFDDRMGVAPGTGPAPRPLPGMDKDHKILLDALGFDPAGLDTLVVRTGFKPEAVSSMMLILELEGHVQAAPGGRYSRVAYRRAGGER